MIGRAKQQPPRLRIKDLETLNDGFLNQGHGACRGYTKHKTGAGGGVAVKPQPQSRDDFRTLTVLHQLSGPTDIS